MASQTEKPDIDTAFVGAATFHHICKESGVEPMLLCAFHSKVLACFSLICEIQIFWKLL